MSDKGPCYGCEERHLHCHKSCEAYIAYASALRAKKDEIRAIKSKGYIYTEYAKERYVKRRIAATVERKRKQSLK
jgi:hypothetical protein